MLSLDGPLCIGENLSCFLILNLFCFHGSCPGHVPHISGNKSYPKPSPTFSNCICTTFVQFYFHSHKKCFVWKCSDYLILSSPFLSQKIWFWLDNNSSAYFKIISTAINFFVLKKSEHLIHKLSPLFHNSLSSAWITQPIAEITRFVIRAFSLFMSIRRLPMGYPWWVMRYSFDVIFQF